MSLLNAKYLMQPEVIMQPAYGILLQADVFSVSGNDPKNPNSPISDEKRNQIQCHEEILKYAEPQKQTNALRG